MKKLLPFILVLCVVLAMSTPVSADYYREKDVNADDFVNALVDYCNGNVVHEMTGYDLELSNHRIKFRDVVRTDDSLDFNFKCGDGYWVFIPPIQVPNPEFYHFNGVMHVDNPQGGLKKPYTLTITDEDTKFTAIGENWRLDVANIAHTRFKTASPIGERPHTEKMRNL